MSSPNLCYWTIAQTGMVTPKAEGMPGTTKTKSIEAFARAMGRRCYALIGSLREPADIGGYPYPVEVEPVTDPVSGKTVHAYMALMPPKWAMDTWDGGAGWIVFIDELTTCPPAVQAALLGVIAEKRVGDLVLPEDVWIVTACNPAGVAANGFELEPPMANRLWHGKWEVDSDVWDQGMIGGLRFGEPSFPRLPARWKDNLARNGALFAAFRRANPNSFERYPQDRAKAGGAWPSPRSWTNACIAYTALEAIGAGEEHLREAVQGCVGEEARTEFFHWKNALDLPDPEHLISLALEAKQNGAPINLPLPTGSDRIIAMMGAVTDRVLHHGHTQERWEAGMKILYAVWHQQRELAMVCGPQLFTGFKAGWQIPTRFVAEAHHLMQRAGMLPGGE